MIEAHEVVSSGRPGAGDPGDPAPAGTGDPVPQPWVTRFGGRGFHDRSVMMETATGSRTSRTRTTVEAIRPVPARSSSQPSS